MPLLQQLENGDGGSKLALEIFVETDNATQPQNIQAGLNTNLGWGQFLQSVRTCF